ncbi:unnamed protein product [Ambrosiozyma monospora]|uniref:Unnamed protein product n=1 Tax=Ambrosiozyma monospora TaxID=43982 RepID=A0A9W7DG45_AMBMO|nr:unnamed protein product [Ambrosiozyma monospora]
MSSNTTIQNGVQLLLLLVNSYLANFNTSLDASTLTPTTSSFTTGTLVIKVLRGDSDDTEEYDIVVKNKSTKVSLVQTTSLDLKFPMDFKTADLDNLESNPKFSKLFSQLHETFDDFIIKSTTVHSGKETKDTESSSLQESTSTNQGQGATTNYPKQHMPKIPFPSAELPINNPSSTSSKDKPIPDGLRAPGFEDEYELQPQQQSDPLRITPDTNANRDLYPGGVRDLINPSIGGMRLGPTGPGGINGGMYPTSNDPLFRQFGEEGGPGGSRGQRYPSGRMPGARWDDPLGGGASGPGGFGFGGYGGYGGSSGGGGFGGGFI